MADVFDLYAKIRLDSKEYEKGIEDAKTKFKGFGNALSTIGSGIGNTFSTLISGAEKLAKVSTVAIGAASTAITKLVKDSLSQYANYEQLVGGVEKIFGKSAEKVKKYADEAYKEAGLSSNQYMEQVTSFSASLLQGLKGDTEKAADIANMAIKDMADNANTYGTDMASIQNAYQGFAKQNYTMLDNLKLGYGGTKGEMARLLNKANEIDSTILGKGVTVDEKFEDVSFAQMIRAIHVIQEELKITGTTQDEAVRTISGSFATMKAAWQNFLTGTGTSEQFVEALVGVSKNVSRQLKVIIPQLTKGLKELVTALAPELPAILIDILPDIISGATELLTSFTEMLPDLIRTITPPLIKGAVMVMTSIVRNLPQILQSLADALPVVLTTLMENGGGLIEAGKQILGMILDGLVSASSFASENAVKVLDTIKDFLTNSDALKKIGEAAGTIISNLVSGLADVATWAGENAAGVIDAFATFLTDTNAISKTIEAAGKIIGNLVDGLLSEDSLNKLMDAVPKICDALADGVDTAAKEIMNLCEKIINGIADYLFPEDSGTMQKHWEKLYKAAGKIISLIFEGIIAAGDIVYKPFEVIGQKIADFIGLGKFYEYGKNAISDFRRGLADGLKECFKWLYEDSMNLGEGIYDALHKESSSETVGFQNAEVEYRKLFKDDDNSELAKNTWNYLVEKYAADGGYSTVNHGKAIDLTAKDFGLPDWIDEALAVGGIDEYNRRKTPGYGTGGTTNIPTQYKYFGYGTKGTLNIPTQYQKYGKGGIVTKPTLALIGEDGAEAVVPLEKDSEIGRKFGGGFNIEKIEVNVNANGIEDINEVGNIIVQQIDSALRRYQVQQTRGIGGTAW